MSISTQFRAAEEVVRDMLKNNPETRNSDMELLFAIWQENGVGLTTFQKETIKNCFTPETIRRTRQKIQENGEYLPTEKIKTGRRALQKEHHDYHREYTPAPKIEPQSFGADAEFVGYRTLNFNGKKIRFQIYK